MIKETVNEWRFTDALLADEYANWTYGATKALFDYYEQLSDEMGEDIELDPVAIRCDWSEYDNALEAYVQHHGDDSDLPDDQKITTEEQAREWLEDNTTVLDVENIVIGDTNHRDPLKSILVMQF